MKTVYALYLIFLMFSMTAAQTERQKVVFFGDSITAAGENNPAGYIHLMRAELDSTQYQLIGRGIGGNKVTDLKNRIDKDVLALNPDVVFVYIGINDVWHSYEFEGTTGTEIERYEQGLYQLAEKLQKQDIRVIFCTPTVIGEEPSFKGEINKDLDKYAKVVRKVAKKTDAELCDLRKEIKGYLKDNNPNAEDSGILTSDKVHMNDAGNEFLAQKMLKFLSE